MTQFLPQQSTTEETDNLSEYRVQRLQRIEGEITRHITAAKQAVDVLESSDAAIADLLYAVQQETLFRVDGYANMTEYARVRWPDLSKSRLSRMLTFGKINAEIDKWNQELPNSQIGQLPRLENERQARALSAVSEQDRMPVLGLSVDMAGGGVPSASTITETHDALNGKHSTHERIGRIDPTEEKFPSSPIGAFNTQTKGENEIKGEELRGSTPRRPFGYIDPCSVDTSIPYRKIFFTFIRPGVPSQNLKEYKTAGLSISFQTLIDQGWKPPRAEEDDTFTETPRPFAGKAQESADFSADDGEPIAMPFWTPEPDPEADDFLATFFNDEDTPQ